MTLPIEVSIIICTYNPEANKLISSLKAAVCQKNVNFEIIVTDDGSKKDYFKEIVCFFRTIGFENYQLIKNKNNIGTVRNIFNALKKAHGEYVFLNSPGDYIFDEYAMFDFYHFCKERNADICFGDYIPYYLDDCKVHYSDYLKPQFAGAYLETFRNYKAAFFTIENIVGASYFRSRSFALESLEYVEKYSRYTEDGPTTAYGLVKGRKKVYYHNRKIVWYEFGSGISTVDNSHWKQLLTLDYLRSYKALSNSEPHDRYIKAGLYYLEHGGEENFAVKFTLRFPIIAVRRRIVKKGRTRNIMVNESEKRNLLSLLCISEV